MADAKPPSQPGADAKKDSSATEIKKTTTTTATKTGKKDDKKDENILEKTAHSIRDKVHGLTDEVKEKAHHLTHNDDKKGGDAKKKDPALKASSHPPKTGKNGFADPSK